MTSGLTPDICTDPECLDFLYDAGEDWDYNQAALYKLMDVLAAASGMEYIEYFEQELINPLNLKAEVRTNLLMYATPRDLAKFGLLMLAEGRWENDTLMTDTAYFQKMLQPSQLHNPSYGYLWWLNGEGSYIQPGDDHTLQPIDIVQTAPDDMYFAYGTNDIKMYVCPSMELVIVRTGKKSYPFNNLSNPFDEDLWLRVMDLF